MSIFEAYDMFAVADVMRPGDVYLEIGAHRGQFFKASGLLRHGCRYFFYEPGDVRDELVKSLRQIADEVNAGQPLGTETILDVYHEAIWSSAGSMTYHVDASEGQGNTLAIGVHTPNREVKVMTLEQVLWRHNIERVRFLAMNAEQAEYEILRSPAMDRVDFVTVEFHPGKSRIDTRAFVREHLPQFETLKFGREGDAYNQWLGRNTRVVSKESD